MATYSSAHFKNECLRSEDLRSHLLLFECRAAPGSGYAYDGSRYKPLQRDGFIFLEDFTCFLGFGQRQRKGRASVVSRQVFTTAPPSCGFATVNPHTVVHTVATLYTLNQNFISFINLSDCLHWSFTYIFQVWTKKKHNLNNTCW